MSMEQVLCCFQPQILNCNMNQLLWIALGGAIGAVLRYLTGMGVNALLPFDFPNGTLVVNVLGCFAIGALFATLSTSELFSPFFRPFLIIGVLGGFTTFSSYGMEALILVQKQEHLKALGYVLLSNVLGLGAALAGFRIFNG